MQVTSLDLPTCKIIALAIVTRRNVGDQSVADSSTGFVFEKPSEGSDIFVEPFVVKRLNGRIKICGGCRGQHLKGANNELLALPSDICLCHREPQVYINPKTELECTKIGNVYYHVNLSCIRKKYV